MVATVASLIVIEALSVSTSSSSSGTMVVIAVGPAR